MDEELERKAYLEGMKLKKAGLDDDVMYARLEKQGIPDELIKHVLQNINIQKKLDVIKEQTPFYYSGLLKAGMGILLAAVSYLIFPGIVIIPIGLVISGVAFSIISKNKMN